MPENNKKSGRRRVDIDQQIFEELCKIQCTEKEICAVFRTTDKTLTRWCRENYGGTFEETFARLRLGGRSSLRRAQWEAAVNSQNASMLIWLGKQYLEQLDPDKVKKEEERKDDGIQIINDIPAADEEETPEAE